MRRFLTILFALYYVGLSIGFTLHTHHCMGKLAGVGLLADKHEKCTRCGMKMASANAHSCCNDGQKHVIFANDRCLKQVSNKVAYNPFLFESNYSEIVICTSDDHQPYRQSCLVKRPPPDENTPLFVRNRTFRI